MNPSFNTLVIIFFGWLSLGATGLKSLDFLAKVKNFVLIIFKISCLKRLITAALGKGGGFLSKVLEKEKWDNKVLGAIFIIAIVFVISAAWLLLYIIISNRRGLSGEDISKDNKGL